MTFFPLGAYEVSYAPGYDPNSRGKKFICHLYFFLVLLSSLPVLMTLPLSSVDSESIHDWSKSMIVLDGAESTLAGGSAIDSGKEESERALRLPCEDVSDLVAVFWVEHWSRIEAR